MKCSVRYRIHALWRNRTHFFFVRAQSGNSYAHPAASFALRRERPLCGPAHGDVALFRMRDEFGGALVARFCDTGENDAYGARLIGSWRSNGALRSALRVHFRRRQTVVCEDGRELSGLSQLIENSVRLFGHR